MDSLVNILITAGAFLVIGVGCGLLNAAWTARSARKVSRLDMDAIQATAKILAAEPGSRLSTSGWADTLFDLHRAGFSLNESLALVKRVRAFWAVGDATRTRTD